MTDAMHQAASPADVVRAHDLVRMKRFATGLFLAVSALFVVTHRLPGSTPGINYVRAFAEAAMVGALADWFAVTALFRHPLGLPIPHTAIIPHRKDQIGQSLGEFVEGNFLTRDVLDERLSNAHVGARLGRWLAHPVNAARAASALGDALRGALEVADDHTISGSVEAIVERRINATAVTPLVGRAVQIGIADGHHQRLLDSALRGVGEFVDDHRASFRIRLQTESPWWIPESIDDRIFEKIVAGIHRFIADVSTDETHEIRRAVEERLIAFAERLRTDPELIERGERLKADVLQHPDVRAWIASLWGELKLSMHTAAGNPDSELQRRLAFHLTQFGARLADDVELQRKVDGWAASAVGYVVDNYRGEVAQLISTTVQRWDPELTSRRMELQVGRDLQFIRINGTIVGGLAGLAIHALSQVL
jgi:uncharacterized membrane-anchored protein YjiN (DUF445 family)